MSIYKCSQVSENVLKPLNACKMLNENTAVFVFQIFNRPQTTAGTPVTLPTRSSPPIGGCDVRLRTLVKEYTLLPRWLPAELFLLVLNRNLYIILCCLTTNHLNRSPEKAARISVSRDLSSKRQTNRFYDLQDGCKYYWCSLKVSLVKGQEVTTQKLNGRNHRFLFNTL